MVNIKFAYVLILRNMLMVPKQKQKPSLQLTRLYFFYEFAQYCFKISWKFQNMSLI